MAKLSSRPLRPNPFHTYRDPETGKWLIVDSAASETHNCSHVDALSSRANLTRKKIPKIELRILCEQDIVLQNPEFRIQAMADA